LLDSSTLAVNPPVADLLYQLSYRGSKNWLFTVSLWLFFNKSAYYRLLIINNQSFFAADALKIAIMLDNQPIIL